MALPALQILSISTHYKLSHLSYSVAIATNRDSKILFSTFLFCSYSFVCLIFSQWSHRYLCGLLNAKIIYTFHRKGSHHSGGGKQDIMELTRCPFLRDVSHGFSENFQHSNCTWMVGHLQNRTALKIQDETHSSHPNSSQTLTIYSGPLPLIRNKFSRVEKK